MTLRTIRIAAVDDHPLLLEGMVSALRKQPDFEVVGIGQTMLEAVTLAQSHKPEVMLLDIGIEGGGIEAARKILELELATKIIIFTASDRPDHVNASLAAGVMGYVLKGTGSHELCESIRAVSEGRRYITPELAMSILAPQLKSVVSSNGDDSLGPRISRKDFTARELDVIALLSVGNSNKEIASELLLSEKTVKNHMSNIMEKLHVHSRLSAALILSKWDTLEV